MDFIFNAKLKFKFGNQKIEYGCQAAILEVVALMITRILHIGTNNMYMKYEILIREQTRVTLWKPFR